MISERYKQAKEIYSQIGIDTDEAIEALKRIPISMHCWQGDDVAGFENSDALSGGIQTTGNYPGKARNAEELMKDMDKAFSLIPGSHRINLHASYAIMDECADRDELLPKHFDAWIQFAKQRGLGIDFNPTFFSHEKSANATLSSEQEAIRKFWVRHGIACLKISEHIASELGKPVLMNIWIPDGYKDIPADRISPRQRLKKSLDEILDCGYDKDKVYVSVESKVFGIGLESYTVGSHEFYMNYAAQKGIMCLLDNGHFHPTEKVSDKISSMLAFFEKVALHVTRPVRWDSDHVVLLDDELKEIAKEIIVNGSEKVLIGLDFFDASINRISAWTVGMRNMQKALLIALLTPHDTLKKLQNDRNLSKLMMMQEDIKTLPFGDIWNYFCDINDVPFDFDWYKEVEKYENEVLLKRG